MGQLDQNLFTQLFVYVPQGQSDLFKQQYSENNSYKSKIVFIEDTHEIYVNGKSFGYNYDETIEAIWTAIRKNAGDITTINTNINLLNTTISNEALVREAKDAELSNFINNKVAAEETRAKNKEDEIDASIVSLIRRVTTLENRVFI